MAFSSILSSSEPDRTSSGFHSMPVSKHLRTSSYDDNGDTKTPAILSRKAATKTMSPKDYPTQTKRSIKAEEEFFNSAKSIGVNKAKPTITWDRENEKVRKEMAKIDAMELSDLEGPDCEAAKQRYNKIMQKRQRGIEDIEDNKRKVKPH